MWFPCTAALDGLDPYSTAPQDRMLYLVHQRRQIIDALQAKAYLTAMVNPEGAEKAAQEYLAMAIPVDPEAARLRDVRQQRLADAIGKMAPIPLSMVRAGSAPGRRP